MNQQKIDRMKVNMSKTESKVLDCIPKRAWWTRHKINTELIRNKIQLSTRELDRCLQTLGERGLIKGNQEEGFTQVQATKIRAVKTKQLDPVEPLPRSPAEIMDDLSGKVMEVAAAMESASEEIRGYFEHLEAAAEKLKTLQSLLKD